MLTQAVVSPLRSTTRYPGRHPGCELVTAGRRAPRLAGFLKSRLRASIVRPVTEIPEHLLKRSQARRAGGEAADAAGSPATTPATTTPAVAQSATPAVATPKAEVVPAGPPPVKPDIAVVAAYKPPISPSDLAAVVAADLLALVDLSTGMFEMDFDAEGNLLFTRRRLNQCY